MARRLMADTGSALSLRGVQKTFPGQRALVGVDLDLRRGEVRALLGENGSGKSTLIKILAGYHQPDPGAEATCGGVPFTLGSASAAQAAGLRFVHQDLGLVEQLDLIDNLALGHSYVGRRWVGRRREAAEARRLLAEHGLGDLDVSAPLQRLTPAERTILAIARALRDGATGDLVLVLDEPTSALPGPEVARLFDVIRAVRDVGGSILYVTHRLQEVLTIADSVTVLRDGARVADRPVGELTESELVELLVGRAVVGHAIGRPPAGGEVRLSVVGLTGDRVRDLTLELRAGEVVGVAGVAGSGREELAYLLSGATPPLRGRVSVAGTRLRPPSPGAALAAGLAFAGADRQRQSAIPEFTLRENVTLSAVPARHGWLSIRSERRDAANWLQELDVRPPRPELRMASLSGGNQQRVVLARLLRCEPKVLVIDEPTRGVDVGAKVEIHAILRRTARAGATVLICSSDAEELAGACDRVLVLTGGRLSGELSGSELTEQSIVEHTQRITEGASA